MLTMSETIVAGPVIIEDNKVLLIKEIKDGSIGLWFFPGGTMERSDPTPEAACIREAAEELGLTITIIQELQTIRIEKPDRSTILKHYLATRTGTIIPGQDIAAVDWHDIRSLPTDAAPNVATVIQEYLRTI